MLDVAGIDAELLTSGNTVTINVYEPFKPKPVSTSSFTAAVLIVGGANREPVTLMPSGENRLQGVAKAAIAPNATITLTIKTEAGGTGQRSLQTWEFM